ncbi:MAG: ATP-dependent helicase [Dehalococcoidales bacterium]|nr:ATP-dependent helicase [Dehalococcoidales bacterium]
MTETELIWGPPGTGKTTSLIGRVEDELARGVEPDLIGYFSFTRAAANEAKKRAMLKFPAIKQERLVHFRTLHSEAFRLLHWTRDKMLAGKHLREFSKQWRYDISDPNFQDDNIEDHEMREGVFRSLGDWLLHFHSWRHNIMMGIEEAFSQFCYRNEPPMAEWSLDQTTLFESRYEEFKKAKGLLDFEDLIEVCLEQGLRPNLDVLVLDEAQDSSPLQYRFLDLLLTGVKRHYIGGDPNQAIYGFMGTDPALFEGRPRDKETLLQQSWRLPRRVHQLATQIVPCPTYFPRDEEGLVEMASLGATLEDVDLYPGTIFILVRNRYVLDQVIRTLYSYGMPFDNLRGKAPFKGTTAQKLLHMRKLLRGEKINVGELHQLIDKITPQTKYFVRGFKSQIRGLYRDTPYLSITLNTIRDKLLPAFLGDPFQTLDINDERKAYFIRVIKRYGEKVLLDTPRTLIGTIHSVKGMEADWVAVMSEMSRRTFEGAERLPEEEARVWYVGATRARQGLFLVPAPEGRYEWQWPTW